MKIIEDYIKETFGEELVNVEKEQYKLTLLQSIRPYKGHTMYKFNIKTKQIEDIQDTDYNYHPTLIWDGLTWIAQRKELIQHQEYIFVSALNKKAALKKALKGKTGTKPEPIRSINPF